MKNGLLTDIMAIIGLVVLIVLLLTLPVYFLWNWIMPEIFGLKTITIWQALGINLLSSGLFGGYSKWRNAK